LEVNYKNIFIDPFYFSIFIWIWVVWYFLFKLLGFIVWSKDFGLLEEDPKMLNCSRDGNKFCNKKFDNIFNSFFTMLQVLTGDSWMEAIGFI
jgi:hypothetical protein